MFGRRMSTSAVVTEVITLFTQAASLIAVSVMVVFFYIIVKEMFTYAIDHLCRYVVYTIIKPLENVPGIGYLAGMILDNIRETDALAYEDWQEKGPTYISVEEIRSQL